MSRTTNIPLSYPNNDDDEARAFEISKRGGDTSPWRKDEPEEQLLNAEEAAKREARAMSCRIEFYHELTETQIFILELRRRGITVRVIATVLNSNEKAIAKEWRATVDIIRNAIRKYGISPSDFSF